jgi:hypothetical protein
VLEIRIRLRVLRTWLLARNFVALLRTCDVEVSLAAEARGQRQAGAVVA